MLFFLGVATGYRLQDLVDLTIGEILEALEDGKFLIQEKKQYNAWLAHKKKKPDSKKPKPKKHESIIKENLEEKLRKYCKGKRKSEYAFKSNKKRGHISAKAYSQILSNVGNKLELKNISGHSLRKTYAMRVYEDTGDIDEVRIALGHKNIETTKAYIAPVNNVMEKAASIADKRL